MTVGIFLVAFFCIRPSLNRSWSPDQAVLPVAAIEGNRVTISNIRNFAYRTTTDYTPAYYDKTFDLTKLNSLWFVAEPFRGQKGAHTLVSFGFDDGSYVAISPEVHKEVGESFSPYRGILRQFELTYVIADERDVIGLRANIRKDDVYVYPIKASKGQIRNAFVSMLERANTVNLHDPEFYNTIFNSCNSNILDQFNLALGTDIGLSYRTLFPEHTDEVLYENGLIDTSLSLQEARSRYRINERAEKYSESEEFSKGIRE